MSFVIGFGAILTPVALLIIGHVLEKHLKLLNKQLEVLAEKIDRSSGE